MEVKWVLEAFILLKKTSQPQVFKSRHSSVFPSDSLKLWDEINFSISVPFRHLAFCSMEAVCLLYFSNFLSKRKGKINIFYCLQNEKTYLSLKGTNYLIYFAMFSKCCSREAYIYGEYLNMTLKNLHWFGGVFFNRLW